MWPGESHSAVLDHGRKREGGPDAPNAPRGFDYHGSVPTPSAYRCLHTLKRVHSPGHTGAGLRSFGWEAMQRELYGRRGNGGGEGATCWGRLSSRGLQWPIRRPVWQLRAALPRDPARAAVAQSHHRSSARLARGGSGGRWSGWSGTALPRCSGRAWSHSGSRTSQAHPRPRRRRPDRYNPHSKC